MKAGPARKPMVRTVIMTPLLARLKADKAFRNRILSIIPAAISKTIYAQPETSLEELLRELFPLEVKLLKLNFDETRLFCLAARVLNVPHQDSDRVVVHPIELLPPPNEPGHWVEKGKVLNNLGFKWNAVRCYEKAIKMDPGCAEAYCQKGNSLFQLGRITTVIDGPDEIRAAHPVWNQLEHLHATLQEAIDCFDQAVRTNPRYTEAIYLKGACLIELGRPGGDPARVRQAVACFRQVLSIDPTHENAKLALRICHESISIYSQGGGGLGEPEQEEEIISSHLSPREYLKQLKRSEELVEIEPDELHIRQLYHDNPFMRELMLDLLKNRDGVHYCVAIFEELVSGFSVSMHSAIRSQVAIGELLLIGVNATLRRAESPYDGYAIVINQGLASFFYMLTSLVLKRAATLPYLKGFELEIQPSLELDEVVARARQLLRLYHEGKLPALPIQEIADRDERVYLLASLQWYIIMFVVAHELGHFLNLQRSVTNAHEQEFDADEVGFTLLLNCAYGKRDDLELRKAIAGAGLALHYIEWIEVSRSANSTTHPPAVKRIARLSEMFKFPEGYYEILNPTVTLLGEIKKAAVR